VLGSGWVEVTYGRVCAGTEGHVYPSGGPVAVDKEGQWLVGRIAPANLAVSQGVWRLIEPGYQPIDWQLDFKSGFRWSACEWSPDTRIGHLPGVDAKVPWELARMQHLAVLAWAYALAVNGGAEAASPKVYRDAFRNQVLDFIATNPPRFGINWRCTMDVAIRAANWVIAYGIFRAFGAEFDALFSSVFAASLIDHGRHVVNHLEVNPEGRGNHYLGDIAGLIFIATALPRSRETDAWLAFAVQELRRETEYQFGDDGGNFEGSTSYHRLAMELVVFASALILGLPKEKRLAIREASAGDLSTRPARQLGADRSQPDETHFARIAAMAAFSCAITKPSGHVAQIGDNDSGRFFKLHPIFVERTVAEARGAYANLDSYRGLGDDDLYLDEESLDHRPSLAAAAALLEHSDLRSFAGDGWLDAAVAVALAKGQTFTLPATPPRSSSPRRASRAWSALAPCAAVTIEPGGGDLNRGLVLSGFPDFGLWIFRSKRMFLSVRCGQLGHRGRGAHDHNDQLAIELAIDGLDWIADPGSYLYTASRSWRNAYRSVQAHSAPRWGTREPGRLDLGDFWLGNEAQARCLQFDEGGFVGEHRGFGKVVRRHVAIEGGTITIQDYGLPVVSDEEVNVRCFQPSDVAAYFRPSVSFSPGYGKRLHRPRLEIA
jgi:hypothetical protein